jgi:hypothetical protein
MRTYNPKDVVFSFGSIIASGFSEGSMIGFSMNEEGFSFVAGADGEGTRTLNANESARFTCTLKQSSATNDLFSALHNLDRRAGSGVKPVMLKDNSGTTLISAAKAWIVKPPDVERGKEVSDNEWIIECERALVNVGGNTED